MNLLEEVSLPAPLAVPDCGGVGALCDQEVGPAPGDRVNILQKLGMKLDLESIGFSLGLG